MNHRTGPSYSVGDNFRIISTGNSWYGHAREVSEVRLKRADIEVEVFSKERPFVL